MPLRGFGSIVVEDWRGLYTVSRPQDISRIYAALSQNNVYFPGSCGTRNGTVTKWDLGAGTDIYHAELYIQSAPFLKYYMFLMDDNQMYWSLSTVSSGARQRLTLSSGANLVLPSTTTRFRNAPYQGLGGFLAFSDYIQGTTAPYIVSTSNAAGVLTLDSTSVSNIANNDTVTIGTTVYTFKTTLSSGPTVANQIQINPDPDAGVTLRGLLQAINAGPGMGIDYSYGTVRHPTVKALTVSYLTSSLKLYVQAFAPGAGGNSIATTETGAHLSWAAVTLTGGGSTIYADLMTVAPPPIGSMLAQPGSSSGLITPGAHKVAIIYVTRSGYYSKPSEAVDFNFAATAASTLLTASGTPSDGDTVTLGNFFYTFKTALSGSGNASYATATLTSSGTPSNGDLIEFGGVTWTLVSSLSGNPNEVKIDGQDNTLTNISAAIFAGGGGGTQFANVMTGTDVRASAVVSHQILIASKNIGSYGNGITVSTTASVLSFDTPTLVGGTDGIVGSVPNEVLIGGSAYAALVNLWQAVTLTGAEGTAYSYGTTINQQVTSVGAASSTTLPFTAITPGIDGNDIATLETSSSLSFTSTHMTGGLTTAQLVLTNIPTHSDSQVVDRWVAMTQVGLASYYLMAEIGNNTATSFVTNGMDDTTLGQQLNVDNLFRQQSPLPGASGMIVYHNRLITWGDGDNSSIAKVSEPGQPQVFYEDTDFQEVRPDDATRIASAFVIRDVLYYVKERSIHNTWDNGNDASTWAVGLTAEDVGTPSVCGVDTEGDRDFAAILDPKGIYIFTGSAPFKLSNNIDNPNGIADVTWSTVNRDYLYTGEIHIDAVNNRILALVPTGSATRPDRVIVADYREGFDKVKWDVWKTDGAQWRSFIVDGGEVDIAAASPLFRKFSTLVQATGTLTSDNTNVADLDTVLINGRTYTFKTTLDPLTADQVLIGLTADLSLTNLQSAVNGVGTPGTDYTAGTIPNVYGTFGAVSAHAIVFTAFFGGSGGNAITTTETSGHLSWGSATLTGGTGDNDNGTAIDWKYRTGPLTSSSAGMNLFGGMDLNAQGTGNLTVKLYGPDGLSLIKPSFTLALTPNPEQDFFSFINLRKERIFVEFSQSGTATQARINRITASVKASGMRVN